MFDPTPIKSQFLKVIFKIFFYANLCIKCVNKLFLLFQNSNGNVDRSLGKFQKVTFVGF